MLRRYGEHIEADLRWRGVDMLDVWRGTLSPRTLLNLIDHLPRTSAYQEAVAQDDELAEEFAQAPSDDRRPRVPLTEFSPEVEALGAVVDRLGELINSHIAANGGKPVQVKPWPRPVTAFDRVRAKARQAAMDDLAAQLFPATS